MKKPIGRAFTLIELLVVIAIIALLIGILLPALGQARESARRVICLSNQRSFGQASGNYVNDFNDYLPAYSWARGPTGSQFPDLATAADADSGSRKQATDIIRRRTYLVDMEVPATRLPHREFTHLILIDYLTYNLPEPIVACPSDRQRLQWQADPMNDRTNVPNAGPIAEVYDWWWFSSTYQAVPASWSKDQINPPNDRTIEQLLTNHNWFNGGRGDYLGKRKITQVSYPSQKAQMFEFYDFHTKRQGLFYAEEQAKPELQLFDGSSRFVQTTDINPGFKPNNPTSPDPTLVIYNPLEFEPPRYSPRGTRFICRVRWTRGGLRGIDINGSEINTGQPVSP